MMNSLRVVQRKLHNAFFDAPAGDNPRLCPFFHHGINLDFDSVTAKMFCDHYVRHETNFGVA